MTSSLFKPEKIDREVGKIRKDRIDREDGEDRTKNAIEMIVKHRED